MHRRRMPRTAAVLTVVVAMAVGVGAAYAGLTFNDVPPSNPYAADIVFIAKRGVTLGCGGDNYCPDDFVPREQMAAFMKRTIGVATPSVIAIKGNFNPGDHSGQCATAPSTAPYDQQVVFSGGVYAAGDSDAAADALSARVQYRANGGPWTDVTGAWHIPDGSSAAGSEKMASPVAGALALTSGVTYEFSLTVLNSGGSGGCQLTAVTTNRMPDQTIGTSSLFSLSTNPDDPNN